MALISSVFISLTAGSQIAFTQLARVGFGSRELHLKEPMFTFSEAEKNEVWGTDCAQRE